MTTLLVRNARVLVTMDDTRREISRGAMFIRDGFIEAVGETSSLTLQADQIVDLAGHIVMPGFINSHHHLSQSLDRAYPPSQNKSLIGWLQALYPRWERLNPERMALATELGLAEITLSGCTTVADHHYLWPEGISAQISFDAADKFGVRFHLGRGSLNIGKRDGGYAPDSLIQDLDTVISETADVIRQFHDPGPGSFRQVFVAPNSLRTVTPELMRASAALAAQMGTQLHFHLGETKSEIDFTQKKYSRRPVPLAEDLGCLTPHTWLAHGVHFNCDDMDALSRCQCGICHCPSSNMRLSSGVAPIRDYLDRNIVVGLGVDGSASNDSSNFLSEIRSALLLSRIGAEHDEDLVTARSILELATLNGARLLGRNDVGRLAPGYAADFIAFDSERLEIIGSEDPVAAVAFCAMTRVDHSWVHGRPVVRNGKLARLNLDDLIEKVRSRPKSVALTNSY